VARQHALAENQVAIAGNQDVLAEKQETVAERVGRVETGAQAILELLREDR
jgi:hypothetical protein